MEKSGPVDLHLGLRHLSRGLIAYGIVGLIVAAIGFGAMVWVNGRISDVRTRVAATVAQLANSMELASIVLRESSTTVTSFGVTVDQTAQAVSSAAVTSTEVRSGLSAVEAQLRSVNILGATPLASSADAVGRIAASMDGLDIRLSLIADALNGNRAALGTDAATLGELAASTKTLAAGLRPGAGTDTLDDVQQVIAMTLLMFAAWSAVPAAGALVLGARLRRDHQEP